MDSYALPFPILPGKHDMALAFAKEVAGPRAPEMRASRQRLGVTRETVWVQQTPMGELGIVLLEGDDVVGANSAFAASQDPFDLWFKEHVKELSGVDFSEPVPSWPEVAFDFRF